MVRRAYSAVLLMLVLPVLAGCSLINASGPRAAPTASINLQPASQLATYPKPITMFGVGLRGTLRPVDGCVGLEGSDGGRVVLVFVAGEASWHDGVLTWRGRDYRYGDPIDVGGEGPARNANIPSTCAGLPSFLVETQ